MLPGFSAMSALRRSASVRTALPSTERMMSGPPRWGSSTSTSHEGPPGTTSVTIKPRVSAGSWSSAAASGLTGSTLIPSRFIATPSSEASSTTPESALEATWGESFSSWSLTSTVFRTPPFRATSTFTISPGFRNPMICWSWPTYSTGFPSTATMMSPASMPAALAGESSLGMSFTTTPLIAGRPTYSASASETSAMDTPSAARCTTPDSMSWFITVRARLIGIAKP